MKIKVMNGDTQTDLHVEIPDNQNTMQRENKCEAGDIQLLSNPPQNKCKICGQTWYANKPTPICKQVVQRENKQEKIIYYDSTNKTLTINLESIIDTAVAEERKRIVGSLTPPKKWKECLKAFDGQDEFCVLCGFNPDKLINLITKDK